ncbi:MAG: antibiotic biosynthesis monooxygenase [Planctomycetales bacterium]|nr:antibiotic biosynthesis monooxygenase [Planctomycetales bacterium]
MKKPTCVIHVIFNIKPQFVESFREAVLLQAQNSVDKETWCHQFDVCTHPDRPHAFMLYETYDDRDAINLHRETPHFAEFASKISDWVESKEVNVWDIL